MTGDRILDEEEVLLSNTRLITICLDELGDYKQRRISRRTLHEVFRTLWLAIINELLQGNRVSTPIGQFIPYILRKYGRTNWVAAGVKPSQRPKRSDRVSIKFKPSNTLTKSIDFLIERYDAQQIKRNHKSSRKRRVVRIARPGKRPPNETVGDRTVINDESDVR